MYENSPSPKDGLVPGIIVGLVVAVLGAGLYAAFIDVTGYELSIATIGIGVLVGLAIMAFKPTSPVLPAIAGIYSFAGAVLGTIAGDVALLVKTAEEQGATLSYGDAFTLLSNHFSEIVDFKSVIIWVVGAAFGFSFVNKRVKAAQQSAAPAQATSAPGVEGASEGVPTLAEPPAPDRSA
ncbi:hypothetical protein [Microbispora sp. NPDC049125]|uniref:hypothetical protein n=1 Tax=Microbispora sp. NPDC049125 TaxID=3154929 RepID=UPI003467AB62